MRKQGMKKKLRRKHNCGRSGKGCIEAGGAKGTRHRGLQKCSSFTPDETNIIGLS